MTKTGCPRTCLSNNHGMCRLCCAEQVKPQRCAFSMFSNDTVLSNGLIAIYISTKICVPKVIVAITVSGISFCWIYHTQLQRLFIHPIDPMFSHPSLEHCIKTWSVFSLGLQVTLQGDRWLLSGSLSYPPGRPVTAPWVSKSPSSETSDCSLGL